MRIAGVLSEILPKTFWSLFFRTHCINAHNWCSSRCSCTRERQQPSYNSVQCRSSLDRTRRSFSSAPESRSFTKRLRLATRVIRSTQGASQQTAAMSRSAQLTLKQKHFSCHWNCPQPMSVSRLLHNCGRQQQRTCRQQCYVCTYVGQTGVLSADDRKRRRSVTADVVIKLRRCQTGEQLLLHLSPSGKPVQQA